MNYKKYGRIFRYYDVSIVFLHNVDTLQIKYKGSIITTIKNYLGGLRSTCTYTNSKYLLELYKNAKFIIVNNQFNNHLLK